MTLRDEIKARIVEAGWTMKDLVDKLNEKYGRNDTVQNLSNKLTRGTLKYREAQEIADVIGCKIEWIPRNKTQE